MKSRITGRVEEWWKSVCIRNNCKYYLHQDYPLSSYCTCPDNCVVVDKNKKGENDESTNI